MEWRKRPRLTWGDFSKQVQILLHLPKSESKVEEEMAVGVGISK